VIAGKLGNAGSALSGFSPGGFLEQCGCLLVRQLAGLYTSLDLAGIEQFVQRRRVRGRSRVRRRVINHGTSSMSWNRHGEVPHRNAEEGARTMPED
jgi:hypothetical protein